MKYFCHRDEKKIHRDSLEKRLSMIVSVMSAAGAAEYRAVNLGKFILRAVADQPHKYVSRRNGVRDGSILKVFFIL